MSESTILRLKSEADHWMEQAMNKSTELAKLREENDKLNNSNVILSEAYYRNESTIKELVDVLEESKLQIEYLQKKVGVKTGSGNNVLSRIESVLSKSEK